MCYCVFVCREIAWHDLAFYNVDLFEGLRRLLIDAEEKKMSKEEFQSTYCLCFEVLYKNLACFYV